MTAKSTLFWILHSSALITVLRASGAVLGVLNALVLSNFMDPDFFGLVMLGISVAMFLATISSLNIESGNYRFLTKYLKDDKLANAKAYISFSTRILRIYSLIIFVLLCLTTLIYLYTYNTNNNSMWIVLSLGVLSSPFLGYLRVKELYGFAMDAGVRSLIAPVFIYRGFFLLLISITLLVDRNPSAELIMTEYFISAGIAAMSQYLIQSRVFNHIKMHASENHDDKKSWIAHSSQMLIPRIYVQNNSDLIIILSSIFLEEYEIGLLSVCMRIRGVFNLSLLGVNQAVNPRMAMLIHSHDLISTRELLLKSGLLKMILVMIMLTIVYFYSDLILGAFNQDVETGRAILLILIFGQLLSVLAGPSISTMSMLGLQKNMIVFLILSFIGICIVILTSAMTTGLIGMTAVSVFAFFILYLSISRKIREQEHINVSLI